MPAQQGSRGDDQAQLPELAPRQQPGKRGRSRMTSMFAISTWLTRDDWPARPEQLTGSRPGMSARPRAFVLIPVMFAMPITGAVPGGTAPGSAACGARLAEQSVHEPCHLWPSGDAAPSGTTRGTGNGTAASQGCPARRDPAARRRQGKRGLSSSRGVLSAVRGNCPLGRDPAWLSRLEVAHMATVELLARVCGNRQSG